MTERPDELIDWWLGLRHGGQLIDRGHLDAMPEPQPLPWNLPETLRSAVTALPDQGAATGAALTTLMDLLLERVTGLGSGWLKGAQVGSEYAETLLDGTRWKPRRVWNGANDASLYVFTTKVRQVGLHKGRRPVAQITEYLRRHGVPLGLVTNGRQWRLIYADPDTQAWVEWDTNEFFSGGRLSDSVVGFSRLLGRQALTPSDGAARSPLLTAIAETRQGQARLSAELGERVRKAVEALLVSRRPVLEATWQERDAQAVYVAACHFVMRLVVTLFAEARGMLPQENPIYHNAYGVTGLLESLDRVSRLRRRSGHSAWSRLLALFSLLYEGSPHPALTLPAYGGELFRPGREDGDSVGRALHVLESTQSPPDDEVVHEILVMLTRTTVRVRDGRAWRRVTEPVNFTDLSSEYIGILYEGLLDYELQKAGDDAVLFLNLGDQPALPISRLEAMDDKAIKALVEKVKDTKGLVIAEDEGEDEGLEDDGEGRADESTDPALEDEEAEGDADDLREAALRRAMAWALRAVKVGKFVKKARGKELLDQQQRAADALISDLKLPGELYLVRWGGTRKGSGTFYTRPQLTMPTVRRTLRPLTHVETDGGRQARTPEEILQLKVVDPAMGSASFLVAALRVLTKAVIEGAYAHGRVHSEGNRTRVDISTLAAGDRVFPFPSEDPRFDEDFEDCIKRYVVEHCLYGVDINPLAVELARVALWVETLDDKLPFTFLDHKLKVGNALVGCWLDRFREYPVAAWNRKSPDVKHKGVHQPSGKWAASIVTKRQDVLSQLASVQSGQKSMVFEGGNDEQVREDQARLQKLTAALRRIPVGQPARRAAFYNQKIRRDAALQRLKFAFDTWCAAWFWPLGQLHEAPMPRDFLSPREATASTVRALCQRHGFFHWELEFVDVFGGAHGGFDVVLGNPPWNTIQAEPKEYFSGYDPLYRTYSNEVAGRHRLELFRSSPDAEFGWLAYRGHHLDIANWLAKSATGSHSSTGRALFSWQGSGKGNTYKAFVELADALTRHGGRAGLIVPTALYSSEGSARLRERLLLRCRWEWLFEFWNRHEIFPIDRTYRFVVIVWASGGTTATLRARFLAESAEDWTDDSEYTVSFSVSDVETLSPGSRALLSVRRQSELNGLRRMVGEHPSLLALRSDGSLTFRKGDFNLATSADLLLDEQARHKLNLSPDDFGVWTAPDGQTYVPMLEGRMIGQFDMNQKAWVSGHGRGAKWDRLSWDSPEIVPQFVVSTEAFPPARHVRVGIMDVTRATIARTAQASVLCCYPAADTIGVADLGDDLVASLCLCASINSFCFDYVAKRRCAGLHLGWTALKDLPVAHFHEASALKVAELVARLNLRHASHAKVWLQLRELGAAEAGPRLAETPHEVLRCRVVLDAVAASAYGLSPDEFAALLGECDAPTVTLASKEFGERADPKGFWRVDSARPPELRHTVLALVAFHELHSLIMSRGEAEGLTAFFDQNGGRGWQLPATIRLADYGLGQDSQTEKDRPVASMLGPRFRTGEPKPFSEADWVDYERRAPKWLPATRRSSSAELGGQMALELPHKNGQH